MNRDVGIVLVFQTVECREREIDEVIPGKLGFGNMLNPRRESTAYVRL